MEQRIIEGLELRKKRHKPQLETVTPDELSDIIAAGACSNGFGCYLTRISR